MTRYSEVFATAPPPPERSHLLNASAVRPCVTTRNDPQSLFASSWKVQAVGPLGARKGADVPHACDLADDQAARGPT